MKTDSRRWWILAVLSLSLFVATLDNTILNVALPSLVADLGLTAAQTQWVVDAYSLVFAGLLLTAGSLSDRFGRRLGLVVGLVVFGGASAAAAFSTDATSLIVLRGLMGLGGALLMPGTLSILVHTFGPAERPKAIGIWSAVSGLGIAAGPVLGGLLVDHFWWGSVLLVNVPVVTVALVGVLVLVPESRNPAPGRLDPIGAVLAIAASSGLVWAVIQGPELGWTSLPVLGVAGAAVLAALGFVGWERRCASPMLDLRLLADRRFSGATGVGTLLMFALAGSTFLLTQYLQLVLGYSPLEAGLRTVPIAVAVAVMAPFAPRLAARIGDGPAVGIGVATLAVGLAVMGWWASTSSYLPVLVGGVLLGAGMGTAMAPASNALMAAVPGGHSGVGAAMNDTAQELGAAFGVAVLGALAAATYSGALAGAPTGSSLADALAYGDPALAALAVAAFEDGMRAALIAGALVAAVGAVLGWRLLRGRGAPVAAPVPVPVYEA